MECSSEDLLKRSEEQETALDADKMRLNLGRDYLNVPHQSFKDTISYMNSNMLHTVCDVMYLERVTKYFQHNFTY